MKAEPTVHSEAFEELERPAYRVNYWERPGSSASGWNLDAWIVFDAADVDEASQWVKDHANGRRYELFVETVGEVYSGFEEPRAANLVRLAGSNPNDPRNEDA
ncbi:hypothetical protein [Salinibacterium sp. PAMC 21357]|uniref:hypothetical protein n=1 Tax=Salinibacterium sp. PAMC 21357 TaxID=1112215 RepID=UPI00192B437D|nr:hypothetical protein [Salinibacterium sp. PAMC 21357]